MKQLSLVLMLGAISVGSLAQLPDGSISPDFMATDINGVDHHLYSYLDSGYQVILDFSATWCTPCWNYHESGVLESLYELYGPEGTNQLRVFYIEGDDTTTLDDLNGTGNNTQGDWVSGTPYPIIDNAGDIFDDFACEYFPTIYTICPNKLLTQSGQANIEGHELLLNSASCMPATLGNDALLMDYVGPSSACGDTPATLAVRMMNNGLDTLTSCTIQVSKILPFNATEVLGTVDWAGSLGTYEFATVELLDVVVEGPTMHVFEIISDDDNGDNNSIQGPIQASEDVANNLQIIMKTDSAPDEMGWELSDLDGNVIASMLPGSEDLEPATEYSWNVNLPALGCYQLTILDEGGDGWFNLAATMNDVGFLEVNSTDGEAVIDQDWFYQEVEAFSEISVNLNAVEVTSVSPIHVIQKAHVYPNPSQTTTTVEFYAPRAEQAGLIVRNVTGQEVLAIDLGMLPAGQHRETLDVSGLEVGTYLMEFQLGSDVQSLIFLRQ